MDLQSILDDLDAFIRLRHPGLYPCLRPGLPDRELERLGQTLLPYHVPGELEVLYRWHDGWESRADAGYPALLPDAQFMPLAEVIGGHQAWRETLGVDGWHPLWFPAFGIQSGELVALQLEPHRPAGQVYGFHTELDLSTSYDSVTALFATALDLWQRGLLPDDTAYPEIRRIAAEHNPRSRTPEGASRQEISRSSTRDWPTAWKEVLGIEPMARADEAELVTIAELTAGRSWARPVRAELKGIGGSSDRFLATARDGTGAVTVFFMRERTTNYREASGSGRYDLWLEPLPASAQVAESVRPLVAAGHALYLVTKVVPL